MKRLLLKRILPFVMAIIMLASFCFPAGAFTIGSSGKTEEAQPYYTIEFNDGVLRVKLNPQKVFDLLADGNLTRSEIEQFIPKEVLDALDGGVSRDALLALASEYINAEEMQKLLALLPQDLLTKYFLNPEFLEQLITLDEILGMIDVDALLAGIEDEEKFNAELNALLAPVLGDLLTETVQNNLLNDKAFMESVLSDAIDRLLDEHEAEVMAVLPELVTDEIVDSILSNDQYKSALAEMVRNDEHILPMILESDDISHRLALYLENDENRDHAIEFVEDEAVIAEIKAHPEWLMTEEVIAYMFRHNKLTTAIMLEVFGEDVLRDMIMRDDCAILKQLMKNDELINSVIGSDGFSEIAATVVTNDLFAVLMSKSTFNIADYISEDRLSEILAGKVSPKQLVDAGLIAIDDTFASKFPMLTAQALIANGHLDPSKIDISKVRGIDAKVLYDNGLIDANAIVVGYGIVADDVLDLMSDDQKEEAYDNGWDTAAELIEAYPALLTALANAKGITPASLLNKNLIDMDAVLNAFPNAIDLSDILATEGALKVDAILAHSAYGISAKAILEAELVKADEVIEAFDLSLADLALTPAELKTLAQVMMADAEIKVALKDSFVEQIKAGALDPMDFIAYIDLAAIANDENNGIDMVTLVHDLVDSDPKADEHLAALVAKVSLSTAEYKEIFAEIGYAECMVILEDHLDEILNDIGLDPFFAHFPVMDLTDALFGTDEQSGFMYLVNENIFTFDKIATAIGGVEAPEADDATKKSVGLATLASKLDSGLVVEKLGDLLMQYVTFEQIVEYAGGYQTVLGWYTTEELTAIVNKIGTDKLFNLIKDNGILQSPATKAAAKNIIQKILSDKAKLKSFVKGLKTPLTQILLEEISTMKLNGTTFFKNGLIDLEVAVREILNSIPDVATFCDMKEGDVFVGMVLQTKFRNDGDVSIGIEISFEGDFSKLQKLAERQKDLFALEIGEDDLDVHVSSVLPAKVAELYGKVLESDRLPAELKGKLLPLFDKTLPEAVAILGKLSDEELAKIADAVNGKLDAVLAKANALTERLPGQVADRVDAILSKLRTAEGIAEMIAKLDTVLEKLPARAKTMKISAMYEGSGEFEMNPINYEINIEDKITSLLGLPAGMLKADLDGAFSANVTFEGLYRLTLVDREANETVFFLPAGTDLSILASVDGLDLSVFAENLPAVMPEMDTIVTPPLQEEEYELIFVLHNPDGTTAMLDRIIYLKDDATLPTAPKTPAAIRGYRVVWGDYESILGAEKTQVVDVRYQTVVYQLTFVKGEQTVKVPFTVETIDALTLPATDAAGTGEYFVWTIEGTAWTLEEVKSYLKNPANALDSLGVFEQTKNYTVYTVSFYNLDGELFHTTDYTVQGLVAGQFMPTLPASANGYKNFWWNNTDKEAFDPDTFNVAVAKDLDVYVKADLLKYSYIFKFADSAKPSVTVEYDVTTTWADFVLMMPALSADAADGDYTYSWSMDPEATFPLLEEGTTITEIKTYRTYTVTFVTSLGQVSVNYKSTDDTAAIIAKFPELSDSTVAMGAGWYVDANGNDTCDAGEEWSAADFTTDLKKSFTVKEHFTYIDYTYTFIALDGRVEEIYVNAGLTRDEVLALIPAHSAVGVAGYKNFWSDGEKIWSADGFAATEDFLQDLVLVEQTGAITYTLQFVANGMASGDATIDYTVESDWNELKASVPVLENDTLAFDYFWYVDLDNNGQFDGADYKFDPETFSVTAIRNLTVRAERGYNSYTYRFVFLDGREYSFEINTFVTREEYINISAPEANGYHHTPATPGYYNVWMLNGNVWQSEDYRQDESALANKVFYETAVATVYTITFEKLTNIGHTVTYTVESVWADKIAEIPALEADTSLYTYGWYVDTNGNGQYDAGEEWNPLGFDVNTKASFTVKEYRTTKQYSIYFEKLGEGSKYVYYTTAADWNALMAEIPALEADTALVAYGWYLDADKDGKYDAGEEWDPASFDVNEQKNLVIKEYSKLKDYTVTFEALDGTTYTVTLNGNTTEAEFLLMVPALSTPVKGYNNVWKLDGATWTPESFEQNSDALVGKTVTEVAEAITYYVRLEKPGITKSVSYTVETNWAEKVGEITSWKTPDTALYAYGWYVDANGNGQYDAGEAWNPATFDVQTAKDITVCEYTAMKDYTVTFVALNGTTYTVTLNAASTKDDLIAQMPALSTPNKGYTNGWTLNGAAWTADSFVAGSETLIGKTITEAQTPITYTITFVPLKNETTVETGTVKTVTYNVTTTALTGVPALHTVGSKNNNLFSGYVWYVDANANGAYDAGEEWTAESFDAGVAENYTVREYGIVINYTLTVKPIRPATALGDGSLTIGYNVANWGSVYNMISGFLSELTDAEKGSYTYDWYYVNNNGGLTKQSFVATLSNANAPKYAGTFLEVRRVENSNRLYAFDAQGNKLGEYYYAYDAIYQRGDDGFDVAVSLVDAPDVSYYDFAGWRYAGNKLNAPAITDRVFNLATFIDDLGIDLENGTSASKRINIMPAYTAHVYTLTFKADGMTDVLVNYTVESDKNALSIPSAPAQTAYLTYAWYLDANGNGQYDEGEAWNISKLDLTSPADYTIEVYSYPTVHHYIFRFDSGSTFSCDYTYLTDLATFKQMIPDNTARDKAYTYAWYVDANGNGQYDAGEEWMPERFCENGLGTYEVEEYRILNEYTITFVSFDGTRTPITYTVKTTKAEIEAQMPAQTAMTLLYQYYWAKGEDRWTIDSFQAGVASALDDYEIVEKQEGRPYIITFIPMTSGTGTNGGKDGTPINVEYSVDMTADQLNALVPTTNASNVVHNYYWYRDLNNNGQYDEGEDWSAYTMDLTNPESFTVRQRRVAIVYTMTFQPIVGDKVVIEYSADNKSNWATAVKNKIPALTDPASVGEKNVYKYLWFYTDPTTGALVNVAAGKFNSYNDSTLHTLAHDYVEIKRVDNTNMIIFYGRGGKSEELETYYYDRDRVIYIDELNREVELERDENGHYKFPDEPEILGYTLDKWVYAGNKKDPVATANAFSLDTFWTDLAIDFTKTSSYRRVNVMASYKLIPYTLTFKQPGLADVVIEYNVESTKASIEAQMPAVPDSDAGFTYRWVDENGKNWFFEQFDPNNEPGNYEVTLKVTPIEYLVQFVRADGSRVRIYYTALTERSEFESQVPELVNNAAVTGVWVLNGNPWTVETLFGSDNTVPLNALGNFVIEEHQIMSSFILTFRDMDGKLINQMIYNAQGALFGDVPALPSSADGYDYFWWNVTENKRWDGFDPMEAANLELQMRREPITYVLTFTMPDGTVQTRTYTVLDQSFQMPTAVAPAGRELRWYYMDGENQIWWTKDDIYVGSLELTGSFELIEYQVTFHPEKGNDIFFAMTVADTKYAPSVSPKPYYTGDWYVQVGNAPTDTDPLWSTYNLASGDKEVTVYLRYTAIPFRVEFLDADGKFMAAIDYAIDGDWTPIAAPASERPGYVYKWFIQSGKNLVAWEDYSLNGSPSKVTAVPVYVPKNYDVSFNMPDGTVVDGAVNLESRPMPTVPDAPAGYTGVWYVQLGDAPADTDPKLSDYDLTLAGDSIIAYSKFEPSRYKLTFEADDKTVGTKYFTVEDEWTPPSVPRKPGYSGEWYIQNEAGKWIPWDEYDLKEGESSLNVRARYSLIRYEVTFVLPNGKTQTRTMSYTGKSQPALPTSAPAGYGYAWYVQVGDAPSENDIPWSSYALERYNRTEITVYVKTVPLKYKLEFHVGDQVLGSLIYTPDSEWTAPVISAAEGYTVEWFVMVNGTKVAWADYDLKQGARELVVVGEYVKIKYQVSFTDETGKTTELEMPFDGKTQPAVPVKPGYLGEWYVQLGDAPADTDVKWSEYVLGEDTDLTVYVKYTPRTFNVEYEDENGNDQSFDFTVEDEWTAPTVPAKPGYNGEWFIVVDGVKVPWNEYVPDDDDHTLSAEIGYTAIEYEVTFRDENGNETVMNMTVEAEKTQPEAAAKPGYEGKWFVKVGDNWIEWSEYALSETDGTSVEATLRYTPIRYTATFYGENGEVIGTTTFTVEDKELQNVPEPPEKFGYTAKWEDYTIGAADLEIHVVYSFGANGFFFGIHWIWWLLIVILLVLILLTLIYLVVLKKRKLAAAVAAAAVEEEPEAEPVVVVPEAEPVVEAPVVETVETVDVETADTMMEDATAIAVLETVGGAKAAGMKSIVNISDINDAFAADETVDLDALKAKKMVPAKTARLKVLAGGHLDKPLTVVADSFSVQAIKMIALTGGKAVQKKADK